MENRLVRIVIAVADGRKLYFHRMGETKIVRGEPLSAPEVIEDLGRAAKLAPSVAVAARDRWRQRYTREKIFIEDLLGNGPLFERGGSTQTEVEDAREPIWFVPDKADDGMPPELSKGFWIHPARTPQGPRWCLRSIDVPDVPRHYGTVYAETPEEVLAKAKFAWRAFCKAFDHPNKRAVGGALVAQMLHEAKQSQTPGKIRPGDRPL
jgi:hypothetical protein